MIRSADELIRFLDGWKGRRILVVGDFILDHYVYGDADRLSPDAPVPVLAQRREEWKPGGSSNVALDLQALRCPTVCLGVVGDDLGAKHLRSALKTAGCDVSGLIASPDRCTTVKHNFIGLAQHRHPHKMFRLDEENSRPIPDAVAKKLAAIAAKQIPRCAAVCIEDYNKGVLTEALTQEIIRIARRHKVPVLVDPALIDSYTKYRGATCITPNRYEAARAAGRRDGLENPADQRRVAARYLRDLQLDAAVLTLDKQGALLLEKGKKPLQVPTLARQVYDVTGAGDMILAMLAAALANGADWITAMCLANAAAGLEVEKFGVVPIELEEVLLFLLQQHNGDGNKNRTLDQLLPELGAYRRQGRKIAFTNGCFDILHAGHVSYLRKARACGDLLVVGLNSDASIRRIKGKDRPVNQQDDRVMVMSELESVDYVVVFSEDTPMKLIKAIRPDVLVKGADYRKSQVVGAKEVESWGGRVELVPLVQGRSTTNIIGKIKGD